jgi:hypothetical protein
MREQKIWCEFDALPPDLQKQVADFVSFLRTRQTSSRVSKTTRRTKLAQELFIGMWRNRKDLQDSTAWVRKTREHNMYLGAKPK